MAEPFERALLARAAAVPDAVTVTPPAVWRAVRRRRRVRRAAATTGACALLGVVVGAGIATWPPEPTVTTVALTTPEPPSAEVADAIDTTAEEPVHQASSSQLSATRTSGHVDSVYSTDATVAAGWAGAGCADPAADGTLVTRVLLRSVAARLTGALDVAPDDVTLCYDPLMLEVHVADASPPGLEAIATEAARLGVTVRWVGRGDDVAIPASEEADE